MNKISCDVCMDLMPLVIDGIASDDTIYAVTEHIKTCDNCKAFYNKPTIPEMDDVKVVSKLKKQVNNFMVLVVIITTMFGASITGTELVFYNIVLMPIVGGLSYTLLKDKFIFALLFIFVTVCSTNTAWVFIESNQFFLSLLGSIWYAGLYVTIAMIGVAVAWLLNFGFKKEK